MGAAKRLGLEPSKVVLTGQWDLGGIVSWNISTWPFYGPGLPHIMVAGLKGKWPKKMRESGGHHVTYADLHLEVTHVTSAHSLYQSSQSLSPTQIPPKEKVNFLA